MWLGSWGREDVASSHFARSSLTSRQVQEAAGGAWCVFLATTQGAAHEEPQKIAGSTFPVLGELGCLHRRSREMLQGMETEGHTRFFTRCLRDIVTALNENA